MQTIDVGLAGAAYRIMIDVGLLDRVGAIVRDQVGHDRVLLVNDSRLTDTYGHRAVKSLHAAGLAVTPFELYADERHKILKTVAEIYDTMVSAMLERRSSVVALGGGVVGDVAGFAAATYQRGIPVVQVPSTLLAMVDASIGGKTGVNWPLPSGVLGKNLIGAFWQPSAVVIDPALLHSLDIRDLRCGLAECVKHGVIASTALIDFIEGRVAAILEREEGTLVELIDRSVRVKVGFVESDERESGRRAILNLGHTFAHVIEPMASLDLRHGEAVSIGLVAAAATSHAIGRLDAADAARIKTLLERIGLPVALPAAVDVDELMDRMRHDKKVRGGVLRLVLPTAIGHAEVVEDPPQDAVRVGWDAVASERGR